MSFKFYKPATSRLQRSELAVPGSSPKMFEKALNSNADYIFLDLEDAVSPNDKITARHNVIKALKEINWREKGKTISVRINSLDTHYMYRDVVEIVEVVDGVNLLHVVLQFEALEGVRSARRRGRHGSLVYR